MLLATLHKVYLEYFNYISTALRQAQYDTLRMIEYTSLTSNYSNY